MSRRVCGQVESDRREPVSATEGHVPTQRGLIASSQSSTPSVSDHPIVPVGRMPENIVWLVRIAGGEHGDAAVVRRCRRGRRPVLAILAFLHEA